MSLTSIANNSTFTNEEGLRALLTADKNQKLYTLPMNDSRVKVEGDKASKVSSIHGTEPIKYIPRNKKYLYIKYVRI